MVHAGAGVPCPIPTPSSVDQSGLSAWPGSCATPRHSTRGHARSTPISKPARTRARAAAGGAGACAAQQLPQFPDQPSTARHRDAQHPPAIDPIAEKRALRRSCHRTLRLGQPVNAPAQVHLIAGQRKDLALPHARMQGQSDDPTEQRIGVRVARRKQTSFFRRPEAAIATGRWRRLSDERDRVSYQTRSPFAHRDRKQVGEQRQFQAHGRWRFALWSRSSRNREMVSGVSAARLYLPRYFFRARALTWSEAVVEGFLVGLTSAR